MSNRSFHILTFVAISIMVLFSCQQKPKAEPQSPEGVNAENDTVSRKGLYVLPGDYEAGQTQDLLAYFDSLCQEGLFVATHNNDRKDSLKVWEAIRFLDRYARGKDHFYPAKQIRNALEILRIEQSYRFNHGGQEVRNGGEAFMFRLIEQAAACCNQIDFITDFHTDDRKAGVLYFEEWSLGNPLYSMLIYRKDQGFGVRMIGDVGKTKTEKIFHLIDSKGRDYYLCSNNNEGIYFCQYLYGWREGDLRLICQLDSVFGCPDCNGKGYELVFNPKQCSWSYCQKDGDLYHRVDNTPMLRLILNGDSSAFVVESASCSLQSKANGVRAAFSIHPSIPHYSPPGLLFTPILR